MSKYSFYKYFKSFCFIFFLYSVQLIYAGSDLACEAALSSIRKIDQFAEAMSKNGLLDESQLDLFNVYRARAFGDPEYDTRYYEMNDVFRFLEENPDLSKILVREQLIRFEESFVARDEKLQELLEKFKRINLNKIRNLFHIEEHLNFWNHILSFPKPESSKGLAKFQRKGLKQKHHNLFLTYLDGFISQTERKFISEVSYNYQVRVAVLFRILEQAKSKLEAMGKNTDPISQAILDLVSAAGFLNTHYLNLLNSSNFLDNREGLEKILNDRDVLAVALGYRGFSQFKEFFGKPSEAQQPIENIERDLLERGDQLQNRTTSSTSQTFRLRALSLHESPFRSCLGGDCTTYAYFKNGLDPNFLFFTLTNEQNKSSGQITIVLGEAEDESGQSVKTAFVDNIHNVPIKRIYPMLEGIRLSLSEHGYRLAFSKLNKLSNEKTIRNYVASEILPDLHWELYYYTPHKHKGTELFENDYYRTMDTTNVLEFKESSIQNEGGFTITSGQKYFPKKISNDLDLEDLTNLKYSDKEEHQLLFLNNLALFFIKPPVKNVFEFIRESTLIPWLEKSPYFSVRKISFYMLLKFFPPEDIDINFLEFYLSKYFTKEERKYILNEIAQKSRSVGSSLYRLRTLFSSSLAKVDNSEEINSIPSQYWRIADKLLVVLEAVDIGNINVINFLISKWRNGIESYSSAITREAIREGKTDIIRLLIKEEIKIKNVHSHLERAIEQGQTDIAELLAGRPSLGKRWILHFKALKNIKNKIFYKPEE